jgi:hypothetical protein
MTNNDCPSGRICNNKFCIQQSSGCTETDSLKDVFTKGTTTGTPSQDCSSGSCTDSCIGGNLVEYYCGTNGIVYAYTGSETFCANGCLNGACNRNGCQDTSWTPSPITRCVNELLHQTSNCQNTRYIYGTKTCSSGYLCLYGQCYQDTNTINSWVNSPSECVTPKPSACADKRCVTSESDCSSASCPGNCPSGTYSCAYGLCVEYHPSCTSTSQCNDNNACTTDACTSGACYHTSISGCGGTGTNQTIDACNNQCLGFIQSCDSATKTCKMSSFIWIVIGLFGLVIAASAVKKK